MAYVPAANTVEACIRYTQNGVPAEFCLNFKFPGALTTTIMQNLGKIIVDWIIGSWISLVTTSVTFNEVYLTDLTTNSSPAFAWFNGTSANLPQNGTLTGSVNSQQASAVVSLRTPNRGRSFRGRTYLSGFEVAQTVDSNHWASTPLASWLAAYNNLIANVAFGTGAVQVVVSRFSGGVAHSSAVLTPVSSTQIDALIGTQRRRLK